MRPDLRPALLLTGFFILSRVVYATLLQVHFNATPLNHFLQFLDPRLLRERLGESLLHLHFQPPGYNLFLGLVLKLFPERTDLAFHCIHLLLGLGFTLSLYGLMRRLRVPERLALGLAAAHSVAPATLLYENLLTYNYPFAALLCMAGYSLHRFISGRQVRDGLCCFTLLALLGISHTMFGLLWFLGLWGVLLWLNRHYCRLWMRATALPLGIMLVLGAHQYQQFGSFTAGFANLGPNLAHRISVFGGMTAQDKQAIVATKQVPPYFFDYPFKPFAHFQPFLPPVPTTGIAALDSQTKSTGTANCNYIGYLVLGDAYWQGARYLLRHYPRYYLNTFGVTWGYMLPASEDRFILEGYEQGAMRQLIRWWNLVVCGQFKEGGLGWFLVAILPVLLAFACARLRRANAQDAGTLAFMLYNIAYISVVPLLLTWGDWNRYRFWVDGFYLCLFGMLLGMGKLRRHG